jgi:hypothetical protein
MRKSTVRPHHQPGQIGLAAAGRLDGRLHLAAAQHRHPVREAHHLIQLVGDEDHSLVARMAACGGFLDHPAQGLAQFFRFLRRQHGCGLVQNQNIGVAVEGLEDLDPLLFAHAELPDIGVGIDGHLVALAQRFDLQRGAFHVQAKGRLFQPQDDVFGHRLGIDQFEVLMNHTHAQMDGVSGRMQVGQLAVQPYLAGLLPVEAGQDVHQRRLAGAVLA